MNEAAKRTQRLRLLIGLMIGMLAVYAAFSVMAARDAQQRLSRAWDNLRETDVKLKEIEQLKNVPRVASLNLESPGDIAKRIDSALKAAGLGPELLNQNPDAPQPIQKTDYQLRSTTIDLAACTMPQIVKFCDALHDVETGSVVRDIILTAPPVVESGRQNASTRAKRGGQEKWEAQLTLTQMIFSPKSPE
ncbi:MAG: hypothetical protein AB8B91_22860 [Rubripirellula sp.]